VPDAGDPGGRVDFALVAPLAAELSVRWLEQAIARAGPRLEAEGVLCVVVPRRWRHAAGWLVHRAGLASLQGLLTVPPWPDCAHAVSLDVAALRDAGARHLGIHPVTAACAAALLRARAGRALAGLAAPGCALLATRRPAADPLRWLASLDGRGVRCAAAAATGTRRDARVAVILRFAAAGRAPDLVAKVALDAGGFQRVERERAALDALGDGARRAGVAVPAIVATAAPGLLATTALAGPPASTLIARDPARAPTILTGLSVWLREWTAATASTGAAGPEPLHRLLLAPVARVAAADGGPAMTEYVAALRALAARLEGRTLVLAAAHNDLTMSNVLVAGNRVGILDWESAVPAAPPLGDLWYALADGVARAGRLTHTQAVTELVHRSAPIPLALATVPDELARELALTADEALLSFHACWLHHAANEFDRGESGGPFRAVVRGVAAARLRWPGDGEADRR